MEKGVRGATFGNVMEIPTMKARVITVRLANELSTKGSLPYLMHLGFTLPAILPLQDIVCVHSNDAIKVGNKNFKTAAKTNSITKTNQGNFHM